MTTYINLRRATLLSDSEEILGNATQGKCSCREVVDFLEGAVEMGVVAAAAGVGELSDWAMNDHDSDSAPSGSVQEW